MAMHVHVQGVFMHPSRYVTLDGDFIFEHYFWISAETKHSSAWHSGKPPIPYLVVTLSMLLQFAYKIKSSECEVDPFS